MKITPYHASGANDGKRFVEVVEVGTRDGLQIEQKIIPTGEKIDLINRMIESGIRNIEVTSFVSPKAIPQLADAEQVLAGIKKRADTNLMALVPNMRAAERAADTQIDGGVLLCSASATHNGKNLNRTIDQSIEGFAAVADRLKQNKIRVVGAIATAFGCPFEGDVAFENVLRIAKAYSDVGVERITFGDTTGMATPLNIRDLVRRVTAEIPHVELGLHLHNTRGIGLSNVLVGLDEGIRHFDSCVGGLGGCPFAAGATGNICTEDLLFLLEESGYETGVDLEKAIKVAHRMEELLGKPLAGQVMRAGPRLRRFPSSDVRTAAG
jgi:hydroxymethylglutaryl-CoA lyase